MGWKLTWLVWQSEYRLGISKSQHQQGSRSSEDYQRQRYCSVLKEGLTTLAIFTVPQDWIGYIENVMACLNTLLYHLFDLNQSRTYKPALRWPGSLFFDNNNYVPCIYTELFVCRSQDASSKQAAITTAHHYQQRKWGAGEGNTLFVPNQTSGDAVAGNTSLVVLIERTNPSFWPWISMGLGKTSWQGDIWQVLDETLLLHSLFFLYLQNGRFHRKELFLTKLSQRGVFLISQGTLWSGSTCV